MSLEIIIRQAWRSLLRNQVRSLLTMLGIIMGVGSFICVVAVGNAGSSRVAEQLHNVGDNLLWVEAGSRAKSGIRIGSRGTKSLTLGDMNAVIDQVPSIKSASPNVDGHVQAVYGNMNWGTQFRGVSPEFFDIRKWSLGNGGAFTHEDVDRNATVCVLGRTVAENLFASEDPIGKTIRIKGVPLQVLGVLLPKGFSATGQDQDDFVALPVTTAQKRITGAEWLDDIFFSANTTEAVPEAAKRTTALLRERHHLRAGEDDDFNIRTPEEIIRAKLAAAHVFTLLLASAASLSLLVGGIGIMNIMLVSVIERTREIGIRLSIGATEQDIQLQFLTEAIVMSLSGGLLGIATGVFGCWLARNTLHWEMQLSIGVLAIAGLFSATVGILFGFYPARKAARLDPVESLRFE